MLLRTATTITRQLCLQFLRSCPSTRNHRSFVKLYKHLHRRSCTSSAASSGERAHTSTCCLVNSIFPSQTRCRLSVPTSVSQTSLQWYTHTCVGIARAATSHVLFTRCYATGVKDEDPISPNSQVFCDYLAHLVVEYRDLSNRLETDKNLSDKERRHLRQREMELRYLVDQIEQLNRKKAELVEIQGLMKGGDSKEDKEMKMLAEQEMEECQQTIQDMQGEIVSLLTPPEQTDDSDILMELFAGVGGQEAMLFTAEMFEMYRRYSAYKGWRFEVVEYATTELGGARHAVASISGHQVNRYFKYEGGVHRVQRVPKTEKSGRIHTSTMTVAVLPQPKEIEVQIDKKDLRIETMKASGAGGQHVNTTDSAVRIVHLPTGMTIECQQERSQIKNRQIAMKVLQTRLYNQMLERHIKAERSLRKDQVGLAGRSEKIRTYNFNQDRITDHRAGLSVFSMESFFSDGEQLDGMIHSLMDLDREQRLRGLLEDFMESRCGLSTIVR